MDEILNLIESVSEGFPSYFLDTMFVDRRDRICSVSRHGQPNTEGRHSGRTWVLNCLNLQVIIIQIHTKGILVVHEN